MPSDTKSDAAKAALRQQIKTRRLALTPKQQQRASLSLCRRIATSHLFLRADRIAFYLPRGGEISTLPLMELAQTMGKLCLLPVIDGQKLIFKAFPARLADNRFGIPEPVNTRTHPTWMIDLVLMPLVAFDNERRRLGMGGGYYDRTFAFIDEKKPRKPHTPTLLGVAHECQRVARVPTNALDLAAAHIVTDQQWR